MFWRRNLFMHPNGAAGKKFIREVTRLLNSWYENSALARISMKAVHIMPALLLQKPSSSSKSKDHVRALERRMEMWHKGQIDLLMNEAETLQSRLPKIEGKRDIASTSKRFQAQMEKGNINAAIRIVTNNMGGGILPLNDETLSLLEQKHPEGREVNEDFILQGPISTVNPIVYDVIDGSRVLKAAQKTKGGSGPSGLDADGWRKPLTSRVYGDDGRDLRTAIANVTKKICTEDVHDDSLDVFLACRLVPLDKQPGLQPIGVGEVLRQITAKIVMSVVKEDVIDSSSSV